MLDFHGPNAAYVLELYERYRQDPEAVDPHTRATFAQWSPQVIAQLTGTPPPASPYTPTEAQAGIQAAMDTFVDVRRAVGVVEYAQAIRQYGHLSAQLDPLGTPPPGDPELAPEAHGLTEDDLRRLPAALCEGPIAQQSESAYDAIERLKAVYCGAIGYDNDHMRIPQEREWLREAAESGRYRWEGDAESARALLDRLTQVETFEHFLQRSFPTKYRFSVEGLDTMLPILDEIVTLAGSTGMSTIAIAMAHRGRLNVLTHLMGKPYAQILSEFRDDLLSDDVGITQGDVKYHMAWKQVIGKNIRGEDLVVTMPPNPSHLEAVNPVAVGMARAAGTRTDQPGPAQFDADKTMQILIHGDAAFPGQGIVSETFNLSLLPGYWVGGTIHIIANNQIGFTTNPDDSRSTLYASDLAKGFKVPIIHVNADAPAACIEVARIAFAYQDRFEKDILVDLVGYRRYGHNELDEPSFTQPALYERVRQHPTARQLWADRLIAQGQLSAEDAEALVKQHSDHLQAVFDNLPPAEDMNDRPSVAAPPLAAERVETGVSLDTLHAINAALMVPDRFNFYSLRFKKTLAKRREAFADVNAPGIDWATAEELAFASILADGTPIRLTGQDSQRGTFSHRHAVLHDAKSGQAHVPLHNLPQARASFEIHNSPLSEAAALGFEYGYNVQRPERLVIWEAQYGDFNNNAQAIIDEFIVSAREKWRQTPSLVLLLPHGFEGAGPDHSSARLERFLQMAAQINLRVVNLTTAAQYFHMLRRQARLLTTDPLPLVIMAPKSLLRSPAVMSAPVELAQGRFQPVIDDSSADRAQVTRLILCSGKVYYDLATNDQRGQHPEIAIVRVEQLYPFPARNLEPLMQRYPALREVIWTQEEPKNMGAWEYMSWRLRKLLDGLDRRDVHVEYVGRRRSASPAEGSKAAHLKNQSIIVNAAYTHQFVAQEHA